MYVNYIFIFSFIIIIIIIASEMISNPVFLTEHPERKGPEGRILEKWQNHNCKNHQSAQSFHRTTLWYENETLFF